MVENKKEFMPHLYLHNVIFCTISNKTRLSEIKEDTENESVQMKKMESVAKEPGGRPKVFSIFYWSQRSYKLVTVTGSPRTGWYSLIGRISTRFLCSHGFSSIITPSGRSVGNVPVDLWFKGLKYVHLVCYIRYVNQCYVILFTLHPHIPLSTL